MSELEQGTIRSGEPEPRTVPDRSVIYQVRIQGHLGHEWSDWFGDMTITLEEGGDTLLTGPVADQAALYGLLKKVRDLGMLLVSVNRLEPRASMPKACRTDAPEAKS